MASSNIHDYSEEDQSKAGIAMYIRLCDAWKLDKGTAAHLVLVDDVTWDMINRGEWQGKLHNEQKIRIAALIELYESLHRIFGEPMADNWVTTDNKGPLFNGRKPIQVMIDKGLPTMVDVCDYIDGLFRR